MKFIKEPILLGMILVSNWAWAGIEVIHVQRNISMSDTDPVYKDYYLSGGLEAGLKENLVIKVVRENRIAKNGKVSEGLVIKMPVAWLKVLYAQPKMSVARLYSRFTSDKNPILDNPGILLGDQIELQGSFVDTKKILPKDSEKLISQEAEMGAMPALTNNTQVATGFSGTAPVKVPNMSSEVVVPMSVVSQTVTPPAVQTQTQQTQTQQTLTQPQPQTQTPSAPIDTVVSTNAVPSNLTAQPAKVSSPPQVATKTDQTPLASDSTKSSSAHLTLTPANPSTSSSNLNLTPPQVKVPEDSSQEAHLSSEVAPNATQEKAH